MALWTEQDRIIGCRHEVVDPHTIWLMTHGNAGQADQRAYALPRISPRDSLYVLEYPGYGLRPGSPSQTSVNAAAAEAYNLLRRNFPSIPVGVIGESIGSGPASFLATLPVPPDKIILIVPFDDLISVASERMSFLPVRLILRDRWDNVESLKNYSGPVDIYGETSDQIIPFAHAKKLAASLPQAKFIALKGGHNDWSTDERVLIER